MDEEYVCLILGLSVQLPTSASGFLQLLAGVILSDTNSCVTMKRDGKTDKKEGKHQKRNSWYKP